jgi:ribonuclease P protein component
MHGFWSSLVKTEEYSLIKKKGSLQKNSFFDVRFYKKMHIIYSEASHSDPLRSASLREDTYLSVLSCKNLSKKKYFTFIKDTNKIHPVSDIENKNTSDKRDLVMGVNCALYQENLYQLSCSIILSRKFGSSPQRNRARRRIRAALESIFLPKISIINNSTSTSLFSNQSPLGCESIFLLIWPKISLLSLPWTDLLRCIELIFVDILKKDDAA